MPLPKKIVLIGGSAGGIEVIATILSTVPADLAAAFFVVVHLNPTVPSLLPDVLRRRTQLQVVLAADDAEIEAGVVYVAPPDRHLSIHDGRIRLGRGPRENGFRPAVDPLFRSGAASIGEGVIAVIVSGNLDDGTTGLLEVKQKGGIAIVQDPDEAPYPGMPASAIQEVPGVDFVLPVAAIADRIVAIVNESRVRSISIAKDVRMDISIGGAMPLLHQELMDGKSANLGCPDCGGTLWEMKDGETVRYRCRVGHAYSDEALLAAQTETLENALWTALRALEETEEQAVRVTNRMERRGHHLIAQRFRKQAEEANRRAAIVRAAISLNHETPGKTQLG